MQSLTYGELLRGNRNFRNLLAGQFISELGNWFNFIAGLGLVRVVSEASPKAAGLLFVCRILPFALVSPIAGTFVDRFSRRTVMIASDLSRVAIALVFLLVTSAENLWIAYAATVLLSTFGAFFDGAKNAATPNLTGKEVYKYDDKGNISEMTLLNPDGSLLSKETYKYEFDFAGNWNKMTTAVAVIEGGKMSFEPTEVTYRSIMYYLDENMMKMANRLVQIRNRPTLQQQSRPRTRA